MKTLALLCCLLLAVLSSAHEHAKPPKGMAPLQFGFIENVGQIVDVNGSPNTQVLYLLPLAGRNVQIRRDGFSYDDYAPGSESCQPQGHRLRIARTDFIFSGSFASTVTPEIETGTPLFPIHFSRADGSDLQPRHVRSVIVHGVYRGIDIQYTFSEAGLFKYNFILHEDADISTIQIAVHNSESCTISNRSIAIRTALSEFVEEIPASFTTRNGVRQETEVIYRQIDSNLFGFQSQDATYGTLTIDPISTRAWASYFGTTQRENLVDVCIDSQGAIVCLGQTDSQINIATGTTPLSTYSGGGDGFVVKFNSSGTQVIWCTYVGGAPINTVGGYDIVAEMALDASDNVYFVGATTSQTGLATIGGGYAGGATDGFVAKVSSTGYLQWATYIGTTGGDAVRDIAVDQSGNPVIVGLLGGSYTYSIPNSTPTFQFVMKLSSAGSVLWSTDVDGNGKWSVCVDPNNNIWTCGNTVGAGTSTNGTYLSGAADLCIERYNSSGTRTFAGYYGGTGSGNEVGWEVIADADFAYAVGYLETVDFPSVCSAFTPASSGVHGFCMKIDQAGIVQWSTYFAGNGADYIAEIALDPNGNVLIGGVTTSTNLPFTSGYQSTLSGGSGAAVAAFDNLGRYLGGTYYSEIDIAGLAVSPSGNTIAIAGQAGSGGLASPSVYQTSFLGGFQDGFVVAFDNDLDTLVDCESVSGGTALPGTECDDGNSNTIDDTYSNCCVCAGTCANQLELEIITDANGSQTSWDITPAAGGSPIASGSSYASSTTVFEHICLADGCYNLTFHDSGGDGMCCGSGYGGYVLRDPNGEAIIDNRNGAGDGDGNFLSNSTITWPTGSTVSDFCIPLGPVEVVGYPNAITPILGRITGWCTNTGATIHAVADPVVGAEFGQSSTNYGYRYELYDPDGSNTVAAHKFSDLNSTCTIVPTSTWSRLIYHDVDGAYASLAPGSPGNEQYSYVNPTPWQNGRPPLNVWLNLRVSRRLGLTTFENAGPACRVQFVHPPTVQGGHRQLTTSDGGFVVEVPDVWVFPDPVQNGLLQFELNQADTLGQMMVYEIIDATGRVVMSGNWLSSSGQWGGSYSVQLTTTNPGLYLLRLSVDDALFTQQFVME